MGQAGDSVKSAAKVVTGTNIEDGVAMAIDRILKTGAP
jgi:hydroxymethylpyrimidine pyrophosphatase-like HAD family hydrolase